MKNKYSILVVDDERKFHDLMDLCEEFAEDYDFRHVYNTEKMWDRLRDYAGYNLLILDLRLHGDDKNVGFELIPLLLEKYPRIPIIVATKEQEQDIVMEALELGAKSFLQKGKFNAVKWEKRFRDVIEAAQVKELKQEVAQLKEENEAVVNEKHGFVGQSPVIKKVQQSLKQVASDPKLTVLLTGETGVGKEVAVRYLRRHGPRHNKPFVGVNLSAEPPDLLTSHLFGHVKGAFTGALKDTKGYFEQAQGGILLLDEIGEINHDIQVKLLRVLENRTFQRIGDVKEIKADVQLVLATHRNLEAEVEKGNFRQDLYERIRTIKIEIPALRTHPEDIVPLLEYYLSFHIPDVKPFELILPEVSNRLLNYAWPGNIRELRNAVEYMMYCKKDLKKDHIDWECLPKDIRDNRPLFAPSTTSAKPLPNTPINSFESRKEEQAYTDLLRIEQCLGQFQGNKTKVAEYLSYKGTDHLRARIQTCYKNFPHLFERFPLIQEHYDSIVKAATT